MDLGVLPKRIFDKIHFEPITGCWLWGGALSHGGYAKTYQDGRYVGAYRLTYECLKGHIQADYELDHLCRVHACVNPDHLEPVTHRENVYRGVSKGARANETHCLRGHVLDEINTYVEHKANGSKQRHCLVCQKLRKMSRDQVATKKG